MHRKNPVHPVHHFFAVLCITPLHDAELLYFQQL